MFIDSVEWELFDVARCSHTLSPDGQRLGKRLSLTSDSLKFKVIEPSGEIESKLELSGVDLTNDNCMIYSECCNGAIKIKNMSRGMRVRSAFISCSHPLLCNFDNSRMDFGPGSDSGAKELAYGEEFAMPVKVRMVGEEERDKVIKFLLRYEVVNDNDSEDLPNASRYRFQRMIVFIDSRQLFVPRYRSIMSSVTPGTHLVNLTIAQALNLSQKDLKQWMMP